MACRVFLLLVVLLGVSVASSASAQDRDLYVVRGAGLAAIYNNDIPQAQQEARAAARVNALESLGMQVTAQTYADHKSILDHTVQTKTEGFIQEERVLRQETNADGLYEVEIEAWVRTVLTEEERAKRRRNLVVALDVAERVRRQEEAEGQDHAERVIQEMLKDALIGQGFQAYTFRDIQEIRQLRARLSGASEDAVGLADLMDWTMAGVLVHGEAESRFSEAGPQTEDYDGRMQQMIYYRAFPRIKASEARGPSIPEGNIYIAEGVKGYQLNPDRASRDALVRCGNEVASRLVKALSEHAQRNQVTFRVEVEGLPDLERFRYYKNVLGHLRWVAEVSAGETFQAGGLAAYSVVYKEKPFLLMSQLHRIPGLEVIRSSGYTVTARYVGK